EPGDEIDFVAAKGARQQQAKQPLFVQRIDYLGREAAELFVAFARAADHVGDARDSLDRPGLLDGGCARKLGHRVAPSDCAACAAFGEVPTLLSRKGKETRRAWGAWERGAANSIK